MQYFLVSISTRVSGFFDKLLNRYTAHSNEQERKKTSTTLFSDATHVKANLDHGALL